MTAEIEGLRHQLRRAIARWERGKADLAAIVAAFADGQRGRDRRLAELRAAGEQPYKDAVDDIKTYRSEAQAIAVCILALAATEQRTTFDAHAADALRLTMRSMT